MAFTDFVSQTQDEIAKIFSTSITAGLTENQADNKIKKYGFNEIRAKAILWYTILFSQFKSPFIIILLGSSAISLIIGNHIDAITILSIVIINSILSFSQALFNAGLVFVFGITADLVGVQSMFNYALGLFIVTIVAALIFMKNNK